MGGGESFETFSFNMTVKVFIYMCGGVLRYDRTHQNMIGYTKKKKNACRQTQTAHTICFCKAVFQVGIAATDRVENVDKN